MKNEYYHSGKSTHWQKQSGIDRRLNGKTKEWRQANPEKCRGYVEKYSNHKKHKIATSEWEACKKYFNHRCAYCGLEIEEHWVNIRGEIKLGDFHKEHLDHNGSNDLSNCVPSCKSCNSEKHEKIFEEWYSKDNLKFSEERLDKINKWINNDYKHFINSL